ncbi:MAG: DNA-binding protein [Eggerthellaceae bacterium]
MTKVLRYDNVLTARVSDADFRAVCERADEEGLTRSEYLRYVARMVADDAENAKRGGVLLDGLSMRRLSRELVRWGHHYNQGVHALNSIKFAHHGRGDLEWCPASRRVRVCSRRSTRVAARWRASLPRSKAVP